MAMTPKQRSAKAAIKRQAVGEVELRHSVRCGIKSMLDDLMRWNGIEEMGEALQLLILNADPASALKYRDSDMPLLPVEEIRHHARKGIQDRLNGLSAQMFGASRKHVIELLIMCAHAAGRYGSEDFLRVPRHEIRITRSVSAIFEQESLRELRKEPGDEQFAPN